MTPLVALALHDREELAYATLGSLEGQECELVIVADAPDFDVSPFEQWADLLIYLPEQQGPAVARNYALSERSPGQDFLILDSDVTFSDPDWLARLSRTLDENPTIGAVSPVLSGDQWFGGVTPDQGIQYAVHLPGIKLIRGSVMDQLGYLHPYGLYGCEDLDLDARIRALGLELAYDTDVVAIHPGGQLEGWKRQALEDALPLFKNWEKCYAAGQYLYWPREGHYIPENNPRWLDPISAETNYGSHLPHLRWAVEHTEGPILEVGTGMFSTPYLLSLDRDVVAVETNRHWRQYAESKARPGFTVTQTLPDDDFAVALIDGHESERVATLLLLADRAEYLVVHDTEDLTFYPGIEEALDSFKYRADFDDAPRTTIVSNVKQIRRRAVAA